MSTGDPRNADTVVADLRQRAAVVGTFDPVQLLNVAMPGSRAEDFEDRVFSKLSASIEEVPERDEVRWRLKPDARRDELKGLAAVRERITRTIDQTPPMQGDRFGEILQATLLNGSADTGRMSREDLMLQALALDFVRPLGIPALAAGAAAPRVDPRILLARSAERRRQEYVAPALFGRETAAAALDTYVATGAIPAPLAALPAPEGETKRLRPVLLTGIGGSGKSALISDLMRRTQRDDWSGPIVVYLDFDQRNIALGGEREWLNELTRHIGYARPELEVELSAIRNKARRQLHEKTVNSEVNDLSGTEALLVVSGMRDDLERLLAGGALTSDTLLVVIDTFEEVLVRSDMRGPSLESEPFGLVMNFLDSLSRLAETGSVSAVRAVVAGRADPFPDDTAQLGRWFGAFWEVGELEVEAAAAFLRARADRRVFTEERALRAVRVLPRYPLILILLADFAEARNAREIDDLIDGADGPEVLGAAASIRVLYSRFLERLKDHGNVTREELMLLANPGLALSIVTPELIQNVLAEATGLGPISGQKARDLFDALSREVWLVERVGGDAVRHVPALRRVMLPMLAGDLGKPGSAEAGGAAASIRDKVRDVHLAAARWYRSGGAAEPYADALAAYHDAFLGDIETLRTDPTLVRRVLDIAGDDVWAMPAIARGVIRRESKSEEAVSVEELAALPDELRREVQSSKHFRRTKSGVSSRRAAADEKGGGPPPPDLESAAPTVATYSPGDQLDILEDRETAHTIESLFAQADFDEVVAYGATAAAELCRRASGDPALDRFGDITTHWTWRWALACLATDAGDETLLRWASPDASPVESSSTPGRIGTVQSLAVAAVALGRVPSFAYEPPYRDAIATYPVVENQLLVSTTSLRLMVLANYLDDQQVFATRLSRFEVLPGLVQLPALLQHARASGLTLSELAPIIQVPEDLQARLDGLLRSAPLTSDLRLLDDSDAAIRVMPERASWPLEKAVGLLLRGRSPELHDPVRAALGDAAATDPRGFGAAIDELMPMAPFWPIDCGSSTLIRDGGNLREMDLFLARLVSFLDLAGLTSALFRSLAGRASYSRRFHAVAKLVHAYDHLLLAPYSAADLIGNTRPAAVHLSAIRISIEDGRPSMPVDLSVKPRLNDMRRLGGPAEAEARAVTAGLESALEAKGQPRRTPPAALADRVGYDDDFLGFTVPLPKPLGELVRQVAPVKGAADGRLDYEHFSVVMHASRRIAMFVAVNIDGLASVQLERGKDKWSLDGRLADEHQVGEDLYSDNILDRGHLVRRLDPVWGSTAERANDDTFHFTNCSPQAGNFNQKTWLSLEEYVLDNARSQDAKVTVFTGPVYKDNDRLYRGIQIPTAYWKVLSFVTDTGRPSSTAYIVDQVEELKHLEAVFGAFKTYQRSVASIERLTGLSFNGLADFDGFSNEEAATNTTIVTELRSPADIRV